MNNWWKLGRNFLQSLRTPLGVTASSAGELYHAVFGRDSLWTAMLVMEAARLRPQDSDYRAWAGELSATILRGMAQLQGKVENDYNEEQPGKIIHEYWGDRLPANLERASWPLVEGRYYGTLDATFLYLICMHQYYTMFQDRALLDELWPSVQAALQWAFLYSDMDNDGLVEYKRRNPGDHGLINQVWRDSSDSVLLPGELEPEHPLAWVEVQGYALAAYTCISELYRLRGELTAELDARLKERIAGLRDGLRRFWMEDEGCYALALDAAKAPVRVVSSNAGHLLWSHAVAPEQALQVVKRLSESDMLTDWGLRTLSQRAYYYNPLQYHRGTVWPFDNAVTVVGLRQYGYEEEARRIAASIMRAIDAFALPMELYCVIPGHWIREPRLEQEWLLADYPESCTVQAWSAAAMLYFDALLNSQNSQADRA